MTTKSADGAIPWGISITLALIIAIFIGLLSAATDLACVPEFMAQSMGSKFQGLLFGAIYAVQNPSLTLPFFVVYVVLALLVVRFSALFTFGSKGRIVAVFCPIILLLVGVFWGVYAVPQLWCEQGWAAPRFGIPIVVAATLVMAGLTLAFRHDIKPR